jgi:hypothetical protein
VSKELLDVDGNPIDFGANYYCHDENGICRGVGSFGHNLFGQVLWFHPGIGEGYRPDGWTFTKAADPWGGGTAKDAANARRLALYDELAAGIKVVQEKLSGAYQATKGSGGDAKYSLGYEHGLYTAMTMLHDLLAKAKELEGG